jgi:hypothetical protein
VRQYRSPVSIHACPQRSGLPEAVPAVPEFCDAALAVNPHQVGKRCPGRSLAVTAPGTAPTASSTGSPRTAALSRPRRRLPLGDFPPPATLTISARPGIEVDTARCVPQITATIIASGRF